MSETDTGQFLIDQQMDNDQVRFILEGLQSSRGAFLRGVEALSMSTSQHFARVFVNEGITSAEQGVLRVGKFIAGLAQEGYLDGDQLDLKRLQGVGLYELEKLEGDEYERILQKAEMDTRGVKGRLDQNQVGIVDVSEKGHVTLGVVNLLDRTRKTARIDLRSV